MGQRVFKRIFLPRRFALLSSIAACALLSTCQAANHAVEEPTPNVPPAVLAEINSVASQVLSSVPAEGDAGGNTDLAPLNDLGQASIVGLGEATHGTREFFQMKHRIFKYLVENFGFRALAFECDFGESIYFDRWINGGPGDITELMKTKMIYWTWCTAEIRSMFEWMRAFNASRQESERIHYIGLDCQYMKYQPALLREYLGRVSPSYLAQVESLIGDVESRAGDMPGTLDDDSFANLMAELETFYTDFTAKEDEFVPLSSKWEFDLSRQLIRSISQTIDNNYGPSPQDGGDRDRYMAENARWALGLFGDQGRIALWAHNGHVEAEPGWMGAYLRTALGERYKIVGMTFSRGYFIAYVMGRGPVVCNINLSVEPRPSSLNHALHHADLKQFLIRLDRLPEDSALRQFLSSPVDFIFIGSAYEEDWGGVMYVTLDILQDFDIIVYFDYSSYAINFWTFPPAPVGR